MDAVTGYDELGRDDWSRRYEANQKVPSLPADDYDFDQAMDELRTTAAELSPNAAAGSSSVLRILRHRRGLAAQLLDKHEPTCLSCGGDKKCLGCDDVRPRAERLAAGWQYWSPLDRWETVERVEQANDCAPVQVFTDRTGPAYSWLIPRWQQVDAVAPPMRRHGTRQIRVVESEYSRDAPMYAVITRDTVHRPDVKNVLVEAHHQRGQGWTVTHRPDGGGDPLVIRCDSKAKARTALRAAARQHAKALGVQLAATAGER